MFSKKKKAEATTVTLPQLLETAMTLKYIGDLLLQSQVQGYECEAHIKAVRIVKSQFDSLNKDVETHPDYNAYIAEQQAKQGKAEAPNA